MDINDEGLVGWIWLMKEGLNGNKWWRMDGMNMNIKGWIGWIWMIKDG